MTDAPLAGTASQTLEELKPLWPSGWLSTHTLLPALVIIVFIGLVLPEKTITYPPGIRMAAEPVQIAMPEGTVIVLDNYNLKALASYNLKGRVLAKRRYYFDRESEISPMDLTVGWKEMSDTAMLEHFSIRLSGRYYTSRFDKPPLRYHLSPEGINSHMSNTHLIPADEEVERAMNAIRVGDIVSLDGYLVRAEGPEGYEWTSSLTREDSGHASSELMYVKHIGISP